MELRSITKKKGVMNEVISVGILVLVISVLFGLTFLFVSELKDQTRDTAEQSFAVTNETSAWINATGYTLAYAESDSLARNFAITAVYNDTDATLLLSGNYTLSDAGVLTNSSAANYANASVSYTYTSASSENSWLAVNKTEAAGATVVDFLPLVFLSLIFGAILAVVLKIILPYINLGKNLNGF